MSRELVETCLHSTALQAIVRDLGEPFEAHQRQLVGEWLGRRRLAELNVVDWTRPYSETSFPLAVEERIQTRLGEGDRRVEFVEGLLLDATGLQ